MRPFLVLWLGQQVSLFGRFLTTFAVGVWVIQRTGSATPFALALLLSTVAGVAALPFAGTLTDRCGWRTAMAVGNAGAAGSICLLAVLLSVSRVDLLGLYVLLGLNTAFYMILLPAYGKAISVLVGPARRRSANGMVQLSLGLAQLVAPIVAAVLLPYITLPALLWIDFATYLVAIASLVHYRGVDTRRAAARGPRPTSRPNSLFAGVRDGWSYVSRRPGLTQLMLMGALGNFVAGVVEVLLAPLVLSAGTPASLARVMAAAGLGGLLGGTLATVWRGPARDVRAMRGWSVVRMLVLCVGALRRSEPLLVASAFVFLLLTPLIQTRNETIWQREVDLEVQGRVFVLKSQVASFAMPIAYALAGPLADLVFEPMLASGARWTRPLTSLFGTGHGAGMASLLAVVGALAALTAAYGYSRPSVVAFDRAAPPPTAVMPEATRSS